MCDLGPPGRVVYAGCKHRSWLELTQLGLNDFLSKRQNTSQLAGGVREYPYVEKSS